MTSGWLPGDLGRSRLDPNHCPRFEAIRATREGVVVWYHLQVKPEVIPVATFRKDYLNTWIISKAVPSTGVAPGLIFTIKGDASPSLQRTEWAISPILGLALTIENESTRALDLNQETLQCIRGRDLKVRRVRQNYSSCEILGKSTLVLLPSVYLEQNGTLRVTLWNHLEGEWDF
jgi:hypothetical protein